VASCLGSTGFVPSPGPGAVGGHFGLLASLAGSKAVGRRAGTAPVPLRHLGPHSPPALLLAVVPQHDELLLLGEFVEPDRVEHRVHRVEHLARWSIRWGGLEVDAPTCPVPRWRMGYPSGRQRYWMEDCDDSLRCPKHAHRRVERILSTARLMWLGLPTIYWAEVEDDGRVVNRVRSTRRSARKAAKSWYVRRRAMRGWREVTVIAFWSTEDLAGPRTTKPPLSWEPLMPEEALERLAWALRLPGVAGCSPHWGEQKERPSAEEELTKRRGSEQWFVLPSVMPENKDEVWK